MNNISIKIKYGKKPWKTRRRLRVKNATLIIPWPRIIDISGSNEIEDDLKMSLCVVQ